VYNEEHYNFHHSRNIRVNTSVTMSWHVTYKGKISNGYGILVGNIKGRDHLEDLDSDGSRI
jgi:hypothetical protein